MANGEVAKQRPNGLQGGWSFPTQLKSCCDKRSFHHRSNEDLADRKPGDHGGSACHFFSVCPELPLDAIRVIQHPSVNETVILCGYLVTLSSLRSTT
jgi:hypothetical protein